MDFKNAISAYESLLSSLNDKVRRDFLAWCELKCAAVSCSKTYFDLRTIAEDIKTMIPLEATFPSENIFNSKIESISNGENHPVLHVDSFLYEEDHIDALEDEGKLSRNYCKNCGSFKTAPITFISHSASIPRIEYIFQNMLPDLTNKVVLDVGSRLGAMLYGAYYCSSAKKIIGVEMNEDLCKLQKHIVDKYGLNDRIEIICGDICNVPEVIRSANVIIFNNVFECFMPPEIQQKIWVWLRNTIIIPGTILITVPSIQETLGNLQTGIDVASWLRPVPVDNLSTDNLRKGDDPDLYLNCYCYVVL